MAKSICAFGSGAGGSFPNPPFHKAPGKHPHPHPPTQTKGTITSTEYSAWDSRGSINVTKYYHQGKLQIEIEMTAKRVPLLVSVAIVLLH